jgi:hypothetical protein
MGSLSLLEWLLSDGQIMYIVAAMSHDYLIGIYCIHYISVVYLYTFLTKKN